MMRSLTLGGAALLALAGCDQADEPIADDRTVAGNEVAAADAAAETTAGVTVGTSRIEPIGVYIVDGEGRSLYMLEADTRGVAEAAARSTCYDACAEEWPPLLTEAGSQATGEASTAMLSTIVRRDGSTQVTYAGWPLYYYHDDARPGDVEGQDVHDQWGEWYLLAPSGEPIHAAGG